MKKLTYILAAAMAVYALNACGSRGHEAHSAVHSHDSEHNHTGHSHEHATHDHTDHNHSEEAHAPGIIEFSSEQADAAGLRTETVKAGPFRPAIKVSGEILPAQGDEITVVATTSGIVSLTD